MHARVWQLHVRPGRVRDFQDVFSSVVDLARQQEGYRGVLALASGKSESPDVTVVALWDSLQAIRASENNLFSRRQSRAFWLAVTAYRTSRSRNS
jgi:heme-degrading monooxygenase HmoA